MRTISSRDQAMLESGSLTTATLWKLTRRDGLVFGFTDHDKDIVFGGITYDSTTSYNRTARENRGDFAPPNVEIESVLDSDLITEPDILAGLWDYCALEIRTVNWHDRRTLHISNVTKANPGVITTFEHHELSTGDTLTIANVGGMTELNGNTYTVTVLSATTFSIGTNTTSYGTYLNGGTANIPETSWNYATGTIGQVNTSGQMFRAEFFGLAKALEKNLLQPYLPSCPVALGSAECGVNLASFTFVGTLDTVDSTGMQVTDSDRAEANGYFDYGILTMTSGNSSGYGMEIKSYTVGSIVLQQPLPFGVAVGDSYSIRAGCDKRKSTCISKFNNIINFRGFPDLPGMDKIIAYGK